MRHILIGLLLVCQSALAQPDPFPRVASAYLVSVNGDLLWERQAHRRLAPASLTKLMTALLVLDDYQPQAVVEVSQQAVRETGMRLGIKAGQQFRVEDLLASALISSDNDSCHALAHFIGGDHQRFVQRMNRRVQQLGMRNTHFTNACGHDAAEHYSTAHDLAILANEILKHRMITGLVSRESAQISTVDGSKSYQLLNKNALIGRYPGTLGLKTGYTPRAGKCLIAYVERGGDRVLLVMLHGMNRWWDAVDLLDLAFAQAQHAP
jgi:serine-type D-Ala-D-Ala carboxypeptidase (penicillin-binding protein 5/6)